MVWRIEGHSAASEEYRRQFIDEVLAPFGARFTSSEPSRPVTIRAVYADGDTVIVIWDGRGIASDGQPYQNSYAWIMKLADAKSLTAPRSTTASPSTTSGLASSPGKPGQQVVNQANGPASMARPIIAWACHGLAANSMSPGMPAPRSRSRSRSKTAAGTARGRSTRTRAPTHTPGTPRPGSRGTDPHITRICTITYHAVTSQATDQNGGSFARLPPAPTTLCYLRPSATSAIGLLSVAPRCWATRAGKAALNELSTPLLTIHDIPHRGIERRSACRLVTWERPPDALIGLDVPSQKEDVREQR
jgi:hypothetical protein